MQFVADDTRTRACNGTSGARPCHPLSFVAAFTRAVFRSKSEAMKRVLAALTCAFLIALPGWAAEEAVSPEISVDDPPAVLNIWHRDIVVFRATVEGVTPAQRLARVRTRIESIPDSDLFGKIDFRPSTFSDARGMSFYVAKDFLFMVFEQDLDLEAGETLEQEAPRILARMEEVREAARAQFTPRIILRGIGLSLVATFLFAVVLGVLRRIRKRIRKELVRQAAGLHRLKLRDIDLRHFLLQALRRLTTILIFLIAVGGGYAWLSFILARFPYTAPWARLLGDKLADVAVGLFKSFLGSLPDIFAAVVIFTITRWLAQLIGGIFKSIESESKEEGLLTGDTARATRRIAVVLVWIAGLVLAYPYIPGSDSEAFKGIGVLLGLMLSLGSSGMVNQLMSGFVVLYSGAVRTGEYALVGDVEGTVTEISLLSTKVLTPRNEYVTVPNALLISKNTINYSRLQGERMTEFSTGVTIGYDTPWRQVEAMLLQAAGRTPGIRKQPEPRVLKTALSDFYVEYQLRFVPAEVSKKNLTLSLLHQRILDTFNEYGVQIMSPHFRDQPPEALVVSKENWAPAPADETGEKQQKKGKRDQREQAPAPKANVPGQPGNGQDRPRLP